MRWSFRPQEYVSHPSCQQVLTVLAGLSALLTASSLKGGRWDEPCNGPVCTLGKEALGAWDKMQRTMI